MSGYTKLFSSIVTSTVWREPDHVRLVWITLLALSDRNGIAEASIPGLADMAKVPIDLCEDAIRCLSSPDKYSRTKEHEGRRIEQCEGGWQLLNHAKYRAKMGADERREYNRIKQAEHRASKMSLTVNDSQRSQHIAEATPEAEASPKKIKPSRSLRSLTVASNGAVLADEPLAFTLFYGRYPRKTKRADAFKAWVSLDPSLPVIDAINHALDWQTKQPAWVKEGGKFIPYPASWLRARQWEDEPFHTQPRQPDYEAALSWQDECQALHGGRCGNPTFHAAKMEDA